MDNKNEYNNIEFDKNDHYTILYLKQCKKCKFDLGFEKYKDTKEIIKQLFYNAFNETSRFNYDYEINQLVNAHYKRFDQRAYNKISSSY